jgi:hypothetical protein
LLFLLCCVFRVCFTFFKRALCDSGDSSSSSPKEPLPVLLAADGGLQAQGAAIHCCYYHSSWRWWRWIFRCPLDSEGDVREDDWRHVGSRHEAPSPPPPPSSNALTHLLAAERAPLTFDVMKQLAIMEASKVRGALASKWVNAMREVSPAVAPALVMQVQVELQVAGLRLSHFTALCQCAQGMFKSPLARSGFLCAVISPSLISSPPPYLKGMEVGNPAAAAALRGMIEQQPVRIANSTHICTLLQSHQTHTPLPALPLPHVPSFTGPSELDHARCGGEAPFGAHGGHGTNRQHCCFCCCC